MSNQRKFVIVNVDAAAKFCQNSVPRNKMCICNISVVTWYVSRDYFTQENYGRDFQSDSDNEKEIYFRDRATTTTRDLSTNAIF